MKNELGGKIMKEFPRVGAKIYSYLIDVNSEDKKEKGIKKCFIKRKLKLKDYKSFLEETQLENKINHLEENEIDVDSLKKDNKEFIKTIN